MDSLFELYYRSYGVIKKLPSRLHPNKTCVTKKNPIDKNPNNSNLPYQKFSKRSTACVATD